MLILLIFLVLPIIYAVTMSFQQIELATISPERGWERDRELWGCAGRAHCARSRSGAPFSLPS